MATVPASVAQDLADVPYGLNLKLTVISQTPVGTFWITPGNGFMCLTAEPAADSTPVGVSCATDDAADYGDEYLVSGGQGHPTLIAGFAPDGVTSVVVSNEDGSTQSIAVTNNVYSATIDQGSIASISVGGHVYPIG